MINNNSKSIEIQHYDKLVFGVAYDHAEIGLKELKGLDALILKKSDPLFIFHRVKNIRTSEDTNIYLLPVIILGSPDDLDPVTFDLTDGHVTSLNNLMYAADIVNTIQERMKAL